MANRIYDINDDKIEVFSFFTDQDKMRDFRKQELELIPEDERFLVREEPPSWFGSTKGIVFECDAYVLKKSVDSKKKKQVVEEAIEVVEQLFHRGFFLQDSIRVVPRDDQDGDIIYLDPGRGNSRVKLQLTPDLYLAQLLEREDFQDDEVQSASLDSLQDLFLISKKPIDEISIEEMKKLFDHDLIPGEYDAYMDYIDKSSKVLQKLRS